MAGGIQDGFAPGGRRAVMPVELLAALSEALPEVLAEMFSDLNMCRVLVSGMLLSRG